MLLYCIDIYVYKASYEIVSYKIIVTDTSKSIDASVCSIDRAVYVINCIDY